ncbi:MAG: chrR [Gemmatimonadetes bacterium]|nr:chrR [Gemmatimonadota bacterium]
MEPSTSAPLRVCGLVGSLRKGSLNRGLMAAAQEIAPEVGMQVTVFDRLREIPPYDADVDAAGDPEPVTALKAAIREADALLIATPEYNYSVPGFLKNAIDWASRPPPSSPLRGKPAAIMGASGGMSGTTRAQYHLRQMFVFTQTHALLQPEVLIPSAAARFDAELRLTDESTRDLIHKQLTALAAWTRKLSATG